MICNILYFLVLIIIFFLYLLLLRIKKWKITVIYFLCSQYNDIKINLMLTKLTEQITLFQTKII